MTTKCFHCTTEHCSKRWWHQTTPDEDAQNPTEPLSCKGQVLCSLAWGSQSELSKRSLTLKGQGWHLEAAEDGSSKDWDLFLKDQGHRRPPCAVQGAWCLVKTSSCSSSSANGFRWCSQAAEESWWSCQRFHHKNLQQWHSLLWRSICKKLFIHYMLPAIISTIASTSLRCVLLKVLAVGKMDNFIV